MPMPEGSELNNGFSGILTGLAMSYLPDFNNSAVNGITYIAKQVFPNIPVAAPAAMYNVWTQDDFLRIEMKKLANDEPAPVIGFSTTQRTYSVDNYGVAAYYTKRDLAEAARGGSTPQQLINAKTKLVTGQGVLMLEKNTATLIQTAGNWGSTEAGVDSGNVNGTSFLKWDDAGSDPVSDIERWKEYILNTTGFMPNKLILPRVVWMQLKKNQSLIDRIKYAGTPGNPTQVTLDIVKNLFEMPNVLVPNGVYNAGKEGQARVLTPFWGKNVWLGYVADAPTIETPSAGYHFSWTGGDMGLPSGITGAPSPASFGATMSPEGLFIRTYNENRPARAFVESELWTTPNVTASDLGFLATNVVS